MKAPALTSIAAPPKSIRVVEESEDWIVVDKPSQLQVHPSKPDGPFTLWHGLQELLAFEVLNGGSISIINRLDRETSGLTLICKNKRAARHFAKLMQRRRIYKEYMAVVWGWPENCEINAPILRQGERQHSRIWLKQMVHSAGAPAQTRVEIVSRFVRRADEKFALVRAMPITGRMHQIRVHLAHIGCPIVGDKIYGPDEQLYLRFIESGWTSSLAEVLLLPRHALHSAAISIPDENLRWESPLPHELREFIDQPEPV